MSDKFKIKVATEFAEVSNVTNPDDGYAVYAKADGIYQKDSAGVEKKLRRDLPYVTVGFTPECDYVCDGVADNIQIQAAIDYVANNNIGTRVIKLQNGVFDMKSTLVIPKDAYVSLEGTNYTKNNIADGTTLKWSATLLDGILMEGVKPADENADLSHNLFLSNIYLDGSSTVTNLLHFTNTDLINITNARIAGSTNLLHADYDGTLPPSAGSKPGGLFLDKVTFDANGVTTGIKLYNQTQCWFSDCWMEGSVGTILELHACNKIKFNGCEFQTSHVSGVGIKLSDYNDGLGNTVECSDITYIGGFLKAPNVEDDTRLLSGSQGILYITQGSSTKPVFHKQKSNISIFTDTNGNSLIESYRFNSIAPSGTPKLFYAVTDELNRWSFGGSETAETGTNSGTNFAINRYDDSGVYISTPLYIKRDNGYVGISNANPLAMLDVSQDIKVHGHDIGSANGSASNNLRIGNNAMNSITNGYQNVAIGYQSSQLITTAFGNTAVGSETLIANVTANSNTAIGAESLRNNIANNNTAVGYKSLTLNTSGVQNTAIGYKTLESNLTGFNNVALGDQALRDNTSNNNTAIGTNALQANTTGAGNVAVGNASMIVNTVGFNNVSVGAGSMPYNNGNSHVAVGYGALFDLTGGAGNIAIGNGSGSGVTTGSNNIAIGQNTAIPVITGSNQLNIGNLVYGTGMSGSLAGNIGVGIINPVSKLHVAQNNTESGSGAGITIEQAGTGDTTLQWLLSGSQRVMMGIDNSDSDKFKLSAGSTDLATNTILTIDTTTRSVEFTEGVTIYKPLAADPTPAVAGMVYYNSVSNKLKLYNGTTWETITSA